MVDGRDRIGWLHVSDLHVTREAIGRKGVRRAGLERWAQVQRAFFADLDQQIDETGLVLDLVAITGDLVFSGEAEQYEQFDREFLGPLLEHLRKRGGDPVVFAVPGNHDVQRPKADDLDALKYEHLRRYDDPDDKSPPLKKVREQLWHRRDPSFVASLFANYQAWMERTVLPRLEQAPKTSAGLAIEGLHRSHFPGDLSVVVSRGDLRLLLVGLNSAWIQFDGGDFRRKLHVPIEQYYAALAANEHAALRRTDDVSAALLLMHHPPSDAWLSKDALDTFDRHIYPEIDSGMSACLFGHMHETRMLSASGQGDGGERRYFYQSPSLFGLEHYGETQQRFDVGYSLGEIREGEEIRVWVRRWVEERSQFDVDTSLRRENDGSVLLRRARAPQTAWARSVGPAAAEPSTVGNDARLSDRRALRAWLMPRHEKLDLLSPAGTFSYPFDEVYIPLQISMHMSWSGGKGDRSGGKGDRSGDLRHSEGKPLWLSEIFERAKDDREVVVFGDPGAGKTTTLEKITHDMLLRGGSEVGLPEDVQPLLLFLRDLDSGDLDHEDPLLRLARRETTRTAPSLDPEVLERLWSRDLLLLLDGLDEIADDTTRDRLVQHVIDGAEERRRRGVRCLISSRRSGVTTSLRRVLDDRFLRLDVQPLQSNRIKALVHSWFRAAVCYRRAIRTEEEELNARREAEERANAVLEQLHRIEQEDFEFRTLVATPLLLTLLCAVALSAGELPRKRTDFYQRCLEVFLRRYTEKTGKPGPVTEREALRMLQGAAHGLHESRSRSGLGRGSFETWALHGHPTNGATAEGLLDWLHKQAGVLTKVGNDDYCFAHLTFQEYLAALHIAREGDEQIHRLADRFGEPWWEEVILLCLAQDHRKVFEVFMDRVLDGRRWMEEAVVTHDDDPQVQRAHKSPWQLVGECWKASSEHALGPFLRVLERQRAPRGWGARLLGVMRPPSDPALIDEQRIRVLRLLLDETASELVERARALRDDQSDEVRELARELVLRAEKGQDDREQADGSEGRKVYPVRGTATIDGGFTMSATVAFREPTTGVQLLSVPGGRFEMGSKLGEPGAHTAEIPAHTAELSPFMLAETPVTNAQYEVFVNANPGVAEPPLWRDRRFSGNDQPVVGVSWDDAQAYCAWLTTISDRDFWLPTEAQWERAARGDDRRRYPWGNDEPTEAHACFDQSWETGQPAPVGRYPHGRGPFGHLDLAGSVWEWCQDTWDDRAYSREDVWSKVDPVVKDADVGTRVCRGGAWSSPAQDLRAALRCGIVAGGWVDGLGFRVCCVPASR